MTNHSTYESKIFCKRCIPWGRACHEWRTTSKGLICLILPIAALSAACEPIVTARQSDGVPRLEATISADGEMVTVLDKPPPLGVPRLRMKRLRPHETPWKDIPISPYISSVYFGLHGKNLLLTETIDASLRSVLVSWDLEKLETPPVMLYEGYRLNFPLEFKTGHYLMRSCNTEREDWRCTRRTFNSQWEWVHNRRSVQVFDQGPLLFSQPSVVGDLGFFWFDTHKGAHFITHQFKGRQFEPPKIPYDDSTTNIKCDQKLHRCLRLLRKGTTPDRLFIYAFSSYFDGQLCDLPNLSGYSDGFSLSPDGRHAVITMGKRADLPREVIVLRFKPGDCQPESVQYYPFKEQK
jgi:hypothetical protein